ncbi:alpha/beta hydrolase family protein [Streptomyces sp. NPDC088923]|uniref:alpha/beta hydrolase family protein n=1 Tax=Streptomyces sp. NPDC088923 TaxID=3365913 RepID=UPI0038118C50
MPGPAPTATGPERPAHRLVRRVRAAMSRLVQPGEARLRPDGRAVAVSAFHPEGPRVHLLPADAEPTRPTRAEDGIPGYAPRWIPGTPDLLHLAEPASGGPAGIRLRTGDGTSRLLAHVPGEAEDLLVSDDGTEALLLVAPDGAERDGMHLGLPVRLHHAPDPERHTPDAGHRTLHLLDLATGNLRAVGPAGLTVWNVAWRGGDLAVATVSDDPLPAGYYRARCAALDLAHGTARTLHSAEGQLAAPALSPDRRHAVVVEGISIVAGRPVLLDLEAGTRTTLPGIEDTTWCELADDGTLRFAGLAGTGVRAGTRTPDGTITVHRTEEAALTGPAYQPFLSYGADGTLVTAVREAPGTPPEAVIATTTGPDAWRWRPLTRLNPAQEQDPALTALRSRPHAWQAPDGTTIHGLLLDTPDSDEGPRPLAVLLHGGPSWQWSSGYAPGDVLGLGPALAAAGHLVLLPNPRGSSGYGLDHARAVVGDTGGADLDDVLSGVRDLHARGLADPGASAVLGHSYGGYLAALAAARSALFTSAVVVSAPTDWYSFRHTSVIGGGYDDTYRIGPGLRELHEASAVAAHGGPGTPTLLVHGLADRVTPIGQAHELYRVLTAAGNAPAELLVYPCEGHEFTDPERLEDAAGRVEEWLHQYSARGAHAAARRTAAPGRLIPRTAPGAAPAVPGDTLPRTSPGTAPSRPPAGRAHDAVPEGGIPRTPSGTASPTFGGPAREQER